MITVYREKLVVSEFNSISSKITDKFIDKKASQTRQTLLALFYR
jgi:hypothetical protein